jgi:hypothetical protein
VSGFHFHVDRVYVLQEPLTMHPDPGLMSDPAVVDAGSKVIYRGVVELGGTDRFVFERESGQKGYTRDRKSLEKSLIQDLDALLRA